jgi:hypothetical protein
LLLPVVEVVEETELMLELMGGLEVALVDKMLLLQAELGMLVVTLR